MGQWFMKKTCDLLNKIKSEWSVYKMKLYKFKVKDSYFPQIFNGEVYANSRKDAEQIVKDDYASELDTTADEIIVEFE